MNKKLWALVIIVSLLVLLIVALVIYIRSNAPSDEEYKKQVELSNQEYNQKNADRIVKSIVYSVDERTKQAFALYNGDPNTPAFLVLVDYEKVKRYKDSVANKYK